VPSEAQAALFRCHFWADYTTSMSEFEFPTGTALKIRNKKWPDESGH
jgi:hypothetical protein